MGRAALCLRVELSGPIDDNALLRNVPLLYDPLPGRDHDQRPLLFRPSSIYISVYL
jgi:hypothetical protein